MVNIVTNAGRKVTMTDYQTKRIESAAKSLCGGLDWDSASEDVKKYYIKLAIDSRLSGFDTIGSQPSDGDLPEGVMSAETLVAKMWSDIGYAPTDEEDEPNTGYYEHIEIVEQRDAAIRQAECEKVKVLVDALKRISSQPWGTQDLWYRNYAKDALTKFKSGA